MGVAHPPSFKGSVRRTTEADLSPRVTAVTVFIRAAGGQETLMVQPVDAPSRKDDGKGQGPPRKIPATCFSASLPAAHGSTVSGDARVHRGREAIRRVEFYDAASLRSPTGVRLCGDAALRGPRPCEWGQYSLVQQAALGWNCHSSLCWRKWVHLPRRISYHSEVPEHWKNL